MRSKYDIEKRKRYDYPFWCSVEVLDDRAAWSSEVLRMEGWCRERVGIGGYAKQGRLGEERSCLEFRFKAPDIAAKFQATFGGTIGAEETKALRSPARARDLPAIIETLGLDDGRRERQPEPAVVRKRGRRTRAYVEAAAG